MGDRPTRALWGIGAKTARKLADRGLHTVRELAAADPAALAAELGPALGPWYVQLGQGIGRVRVQGTPWVPRSRSHETTYQQNLTDWAQVRAGVAALARQVAADVPAEGRPAARVAVKVRFAPFSTYTRSATLPAPTSDPDHLRGRRAGRCWSCSRPAARSGCSASAPSSSSPDQPMRAKSSPGFG